jgi:hypothetical protein
MIIVPRAGRPVAKEVGMGNPAEGNDRTPNRNHCYEILSFYVKDFADDIFANRTTARAGRRTAAPYNFID